MLADSQRNFNWWKNYFSQLLNVHNVSDIKQIELYTAQPLVAGLSFLEAEIAIANLERYELSGSKADSL
jgi:hypothetical protein